MSKASWKGLGRLLGILAAVQLLRIGLRSLFLLAVERTDFTDRAASLFAVTLLSALMLLAAKRHKLDLSVFPARFGAGYIAATAAAFALLASTPFITGKTGPGALMLLYYSAIATPLFEELLFRGFVWNELNKLFSKEWLTYLASTLLFGLWHLGYADALAFRVGTGLATALLWKAATGLFFGLVLGALRLKTRNCYSTMLLHGVMNLLGR